MKTPSDNHNDSQSPLSAKGGATSIAGISPFQPLPIHEIESLLKLPRTESSDARDVDDELGPGDVQYLRGHSVRPSIASTENLVEPSREYVSLMAHAAQADEHEKVADRAKSAILDTSAPRKVSAVPTVAAPANQPASGLRLEDLGDLNLDISIELGQTELLIEDILKLREGSVVSLDKLAGDPVDIVANGRLVARGELLVVDGKFGVRLSEVL